MALSGDLALVSDVPGGTATGPVSVFERDAAGMWRAAATIVPAEGAGFMLRVQAFGAALALQGNRALVGAPRRGGSDGAAFVFERQPSGTWLERVMLEPTDSGFAM
ncbi:MAG: hypothetical protein AAF628_20120 [Planctomycetota bacterium]